MFNKETLVEFYNNNPTLNKLKSFLKTNRIFVKISSLCMISLMLVAFSLISAGVTIGFNVKYGGEIIATVSDTAVFKDAKSLVVNNIKSNNAEKAINTPEFSLTLTVSDRFDTASKLADTLIEKSSDIVEASVLKVNDQTVACVTDENLEQYLENRKNSFNLSGTGNIASFVDKVEIVTGYYLKSDVEPIDQAQAYINTLQVKTVAVITTDVEIPFTSQTVKTADQLIGYSEITTAGENGIERKAETVEMIDGVEVSRTEMQTVTVKEPVTEVKTIGSSKSLASSSQRSLARSAGFICPLNRGTFTVSAYYGDGRRHKGVDLAADKGTSIFAVAAGTVTYAGFDGDYGYSVIIDHGNGIKTRYAHASTLCVSKGETVSQGDLIALVGRTGYATGNHLHFEVIINGTNVDPSSFIGIG